MRTRETAEKPAARSSTNRIALASLITVLAPVLAVMSIATSAGALADGPVGAAAPAASGANKIPNELKDAVITEHLGDQVSINDLTFKDESGKTVRLSQYFNDKPVLLNMVYYECPNLCSFALNGMVDSLKGLDWTAGKQFNIVTVSINPKEDSDLASKKRVNYIQSLGRPEAAGTDTSGWHFLTGEDAQIRKLAGEIGFGYRWDAQEQQYAHSAGLFVITPQGKISRYLYGIQYQPKDLRLALLEASSGKIGTVIDRIILFCFRYNPHTRKYSIYLARLMQVASAATVIFGSAYLFLFWRKERMQPRESNAHV